MVWSADLLPLDALIANPHFNVSRIGGPLDVLSGQTTAVGPMSSNVLRDIDLAGILAVLQAPGGGGVKLSCNAGGSIVLGGAPSNIDKLKVVDTSTAGCGASIDYTYESGTNVPEPGSLALVLCGLLMGSCAKRRKLPPLRLTPIQSRTLAW